MYLALMVVSLLRPGMTEVASANSAVSLEASWNAVAYLNRYMSFYRVAVFTHCIKAILLRLTLHLTHTRACSFSSMSSGRNQSLQGPL